MFNWAPTAELPSPQLPPRTGVAVAGDGRDDARYKVHFPNFVIAGIGNIQFVVIVQGKLLRNIQSGVDGEPAVAAGAERLRSNIAITRHHGSDVVHVELINPMHQGRG